MIVFHHIRIKQFRAYEDVSVSFDANTGIILMHGDNGSGKSTLLNAINWCLYGDTPFYTTTKVAAVLNKHAPQGTTAEVEIIATIEDRRYRFFRKTNSDASPGGILEVSYETNGDWTVLDGASGTDAVRRILPKDIRHLFFFNGERLKDIFTLNNEHDLKSSVYKVAELNIIDSAIKHVKAVEESYLKQLTKDSRNSQKIAELKDAKETFEAALAGHDEVLEEHRQEKKKLKAEVAELDRLIKDTALAREYITQRDTTKERLAEIEDRLFKAREDQRQYVRENYHKLLLLQHTKEYKQVLVAASDAGSIPPPINPQVTSEILKNEICLCGRHIGETEKAFIEKQHADYKAKDELRFLTDGILTFANMDSKVKNIKYDLLDAMDTIRDETKKKSELQEILAKVNQSLAEIDESKLHDNPEARRTKLENKISNIDILIGGAANEKVKIEDKLREVERDLQKSTSQDQSVKHLESKWLTAGRLQRELAAIKLSMENAIRSKLQTSVWQTFSTILPDTNFTGLNIDGSYDISLVANDGAIYVTSMLSVGQTKALGLSLAYGLSKDLGYSEIPLLIDNLYGDLSDAHFADVTRIVSSLAADKQVIIMDLNIDKTIGLFENGIISQRFHIKRSAEDNKTIIEEIE
jgi:DNA sulfur modification protein DndD